jgi:hypothetical protein
MDRTDPEMDEEVPPRRRGMLASLKAYVSGLLGATQARVEEVTAEVQHRALKILFMIIWMVVAAMSLWLGLCFAMLTVIFGFGLPPKYGFGIPALVFLLVGGVAVLMFERSKRSQRRKDAP